MSVLLACLFLAFTPICVVNAAFKLMSGGHIFDMGSQVHYTACLAFKWLKSYDSVARRPTTKMEFVPFLFQKWLMVQLNISRQQKVENISVHHQSWTKSHQELYSAFHSSCEHSKHNPTRRLRKASGPSHIHSGCCSLMWKRKGILHETSWKMKPSLY